MIKKIEIFRFKSIKDLSLDFGRVNIFVGGNGAGKSNILEAIGLISAALNRGLGDSDLIKKGIRLTPVELMKASFKSDKVAASFEIAAQFSEGVEYRCNLLLKENDPLLRFHSESCSFEGVKQFGRSGNGSTVQGNSIKTLLEKDRGMWDQIKVAYSFPASLTKQCDEFGRYAIYTPQTDILRGSRSGLIDTAPFGLHGEGLPSALAKVVARMHNEKNKSFKELIHRALSLSFLPGWTNSVKVGKIDAKLISRGIQDKNSDMVYFIDRFMNTKRNTLSVYDSSEGTLFLLFIALLLAHEDSPKYFALDNVDSALNPLMTRLLIERIIEFVEKVCSDNVPFGPKQIFLTSHNPTSLDAFDLFNPDQRIFIVNRDKEGSTCVTRLEAPSGMTRDEWRVQAQGKNLSQLWLEGKIEGINGIGAI